jgi:hypothetical protein
MAMNSIAEIKNAFEELDPQERRELFHWFAEREDFREQQIEDLRSALAVGLAQADRGELALLDIPAVKGEIHRRLATQGR